MAAPWAPADGWTAEDLAALLAAGVAPRQVRGLARIHGGLRGLTPGALDRPVETFTPPPGTWVAAPGDTGYPTGCLDLSAPPPVVFGVGNRHAVHPGVAVVGTRAITALGEAAARAAVQAAAEQGVPVVSGLARGVDACAHEAALEVGVPTVAVIATHPGCPTPRQNAELAERIVQAGGAVISEQVPGVTDATPQRLMARNRIVVAAATVVVPCEGSLRSGTVGAVREAVRLGRTIVSPMPRTAHRDAPGAALPVALATTPPPLDALGMGGADRDRLAARGRIADAVALNRTDLVTLVSTAVRFHQAGRLQPR